MAIRIGILGYGNLGRGVECAIRHNDDLELKAVFTRRAPATVGILTDGAEVHSVNDLLAYKDEIDVLIICGGSATDLPVQTPEYVKYFNVIDSFDTHAKIPEHFENVNRAAMESGKVGIISVGWDPGMFSLNRVYANAILTNGKDYTFWGKGVSQGHSDAIRRIEGVADARQYTIPVPEALEKVRNGETPELTTREKHTRECFVVAEEGADLARIENNKVEMEYTVSNVHECFENCVIMFQQQAESKNQTISLTEQIMYPYVYMDEPHLSEVCLNIISNAIKYTNTGGWISCNVVQKSCEKEDWCNMIISITDNGIGMSEEFQKRVFETFERERNTTSSHIEGSGIGMGITKKLVELMDGTIEVKSKQGKGSTFTVTIPCRKASEDDSLVKKNSNLRNKNCLNGVRILLVEDNEINTEIATELLTEEGCIVETADDGVACVDMIEKADADYYKMILMDIQMPVMNGYDATLAIRKMKDTKKARIPIIAMTANAFAEDAQKGLSVGMNAHVAKPVDMNILVPTMMKYL